MSIVMLQLWLLLLGVANAIFYEDGYDHHYTYSSESDILGLHNVTTVIKFRIRPVNSTSGEGALHMLMVDSFVQHSEKGYLADNPMKWDLEKQFLFTTGSDGMVTMVHHHPEDAYEILSLKKVLTSTLSAKVSIKDKQSWRFKTEELDHTGKLEHNYEVSRSRDGFTFVRTHRSSSDVLRHHQKTLHLDKKGTPLRVEALDNITLHSDTTQVKRKSVEGEAEIVDEQSNEFPKISSISRTRVHLSAKRPITSRTQHDTLHLSTDSLHVKQKESVKVSIGDVEDTIKRHLICVHMYQNKFDRNRTECVNNLRQVLMALHQDDFLRLSQDVFSRKCDTNDTICADERNLFIDLVAKEGSHAAQKQLLNLILQQPNATEDDFRRLLFHCIAIKDPAPELVQLVEDLCHGGIDIKEGIPAMSVTGKRACLSLGALAKSLHEINVTESDRIVERLEAWLKPHNQTEALQIIKPRKRRSISEYDRSSRKHIETKMVLLQSLGNAGKTRSLRHIGSYMEPNVGVSAWRRAAIHSLRHFTCNESATALLVSAVHDDDAVVRQTAAKVLEKHPKIQNVTREQESIVLSKNYTYPVIARVRRGLMDTLMNGISVHIEPPGIEWDKTIGNSKIGAGFGLHIRNILDLKLGLLSGHFMVDVYDGAYAEAHVGLLNFHVDIVKAFICFKGHIGYNLNVLKDFGINSIQDLVHIYDRIVAKIVNPIHNAIKAFKDIIHLFRGGGLKKVFNTIISVIKNLPHIIGEVTKRLKEFVREVFSIAGSTIVEELKLIVAYVRQFIDGVKQDVLKFYHDVVDSITMALPFIGRKITEAFNLIVEGFKHLIDNPMQSITGMSRGVSQIKMAIAMAMQTKQKVLDACQFIKGRATEWFNTAKEIPKITTRIKNVIQKLINSVIHRRSLADDMENTFNNGVQTMKDAMQDLKADLLAKWNNVLAPIRGLMNVTKPFIDEYKAIMDLIKGIKFAYTKVKEVIQDSKALVQKVFGPKFDLKFPTSRRDAKGSCPSGVWPTTTNDHYHTTGVDLTLGRGQSIAAPVDGIVHVNGNRVNFQPTDPEFSALEIVIENIEPERNSDGKRFKSGANIGRASKVTICKPNFIHVSVRQAKTDTVSDSKYDYVDPSPFLDRLVPVPKWIQECNDHEFRYIGQTFDSGESADGKPQSATDKIKRAIKGAVDDAKDFGSSAIGDIGSHGNISSALDDKFGSENTVYRPDDGGLYDSTSLGDSLKNSLKEQTKQFSEFFKTALFGKDGPKIPNILEIININGKTVSWILDKLDGKSDIFKKFTAVVKTLKEGMTEIPTGNPTTLALPLMKRLLTSQGLKNLTGGVSEMASKLVTAPEYKCPLFKGKLARRFGHFCTARCDCMGLTCSLSLPIALKTNYIKIGVNVNIDDMKLEVKYQDKIFTLGVDGIDEDMDLSVKFMGMKASLVGNFKLDSDNFVLSLEAKLCEELMMTCLPSIEIVTDITFPSVKPAVDADCKADGTNNEEAAADNEINAMSIPTFINNLGDFDKLSHDATHVLENVRDIVVKQLLEEGIDKLGNIEKEFKDKLDFCLAANIPVPPFDVEFFNLHNLFMVGPVPLSLGFGAGGSVGMGVKLGMCVLSMTVKVTLTPWVGGKVWGDAALDIGFARGGIRLIGYLLETKFPITIELVFSKYPIDLCSKMDMILTPIRLELKAFAELFLLIKRVTVYEGSLWTYTAPTIKRNIFTKHKKDEDKSPPDIQPSTLNVRKKRAGHRGCIVQQIPGRAYYDPAFKLEMYAQDPVSDVKLSYAVGMNRGGTDVIGWTEMGGASLLVPAKLPGGVPIYWTVKAKNSQGLEATTQCSLNTYDGTLPDGRVEHAYKFSSHPSKLIASVVVFDDSPLVDTHYKAVGYSAGQFGSQFIDWQQINLDHSVDRIGVSGYLKKFTVPREGKLIAFVLKTQKTQTPEDCARLCFSYGSNCVSFDYETHSETCDFHDVVQGANAYLRLRGTYKSYERLGTGYHTPIEYTNLPLKHGTIYFVNTKVTNVLGYDGYLFGEGTMVDFTPPEPGPVGRVSKDILRADNCTAAVTQQCLDTTWLNNHRIVIDGPDGGTIFSGHKPRYDELYTLTNHYISANWYGFHDDESGIWGYTWAVGRQPCRTDILGFNDPYYHLSSKQFWTDSAFKKGFHLADGAYYVTVQALNGAELGGSLVTTVCHSVPFTVDTTPPVFSGVTDIIYDEDFDLIAIYYAANDDLSQIAKAEFGLGKTKYDVQLKAYSLHHAMERDDPFVSLKELGLQEGIPAWIRIRVTNNVDLFTAGHGDEPILIDKSPPLVGKVLDGDVLQKDLRYQSDDKRICAQWTDFYDPESGIERFLWGVGTHPERDDIVKVRNLTQYEKSGCTPALLTHNTTYYSTVFAYNHALNSKATNGSSDGVLVDITPPIPGHVVDGKNTSKEDMKYTSETVTKNCYWSGYYDPESGIDRYKVDVFVNNELKDTFDAKRETEFEDKTISLEHGDQVHFSVHGINGAGLSTYADSNGFLVDHTPPVMTGISDEENNQIFQSNSTAMHLMWDFRDDESGIKEYRTVIFETKEGIKQPFWPEHKSYDLVKPPSEYNGRMDVTVDKLGLKDGGKYSLHVTAINGALLSTAHESSGVIVDTTAPLAPKIHIGLMKEEEEINENNHILHDDQNGIRVSWSGRDSESGIKEFIVAIGTPGAIESLLPFTSYGTDKTTYISSIHFQSTRESNITYIVSIRAINGAGLKSPIGQSKQIYVQKANVPGIVFDGRNVFEDSKYTIDRTSIAASFYGFESESCNIIGYEWAIGTEAYGSSILSYTNYGLVMFNETHGYMQINVELNENTEYFVTVRAVTGCRDQYILSSSDGMTLDTSSPAVLFEIELANDTVIVAHNDVWYQDTTDSLGITANVSEDQELISSSWALGSLPLSSDLKSFTSEYSVVTNAISLSAGESTFITANLSDSAGNTNRSSTPPVIADNTPPSLTGLCCTKYISDNQGLVSCEWENVVEYESIVKSILISIGTKPQLNDILREYVHPLRNRYFIRDLTKYVIGNESLTTIYFDFKVINIVDRINEYEEKIIVDRSPPDINRVSVVTRTNNQQAITPLQCQLPTSYVELHAENIRDLESDIDTSRYEIALGTSKFSTDILVFTNVQKDGSGLFFVNGFTIVPGTTFYATLRSYNKAGLYADSTSNAVVVSQSPFIQVIDGPKETDIDFQSIPNIIQGRWRYSDECPVVNVQWRITDLGGNIIKDFRNIPDAGHLLYDDEVTLKNGVKYFVTIQTVDALNRTKLATSDGVSVRIQPPFPGRVRDGVTEDINYQFSTTELSANWDPFGDASSDPTQSIHHYEVAIGNDRRYASTRSNIYYFVNVGLNNSYTFTHLNLTAKQVRYYITVQAYSLAGGYAEGYSNGIRVGYDDDITPGFVDVKLFQVSTNNMSISWSGFISDIGIIQYKVGISTHDVSISNDTLECQMLFENDTFFDVKPLTAVALDEYVTLHNMDLKHGKSYFPTVVAEDQSGMCMLVTGPAVTIDVTPPTTGIIYVNDILSDSVVFAKSRKETNVKWSSFTDQESGISSTHVALLECDACSTLTSKSCLIIAETVVQNGTGATFYELDLVPGQSYHINLTVTNGAGLTTSTSSAAIVLDESPPYSGSIKITDDWTITKVFQSKTDSINGKLAVALSQHVYECPNQLQYLPSNSMQKWALVDATYSKDFTVLNGTGAHLGIGYNADLTEIWKSGLISPSITLRKGNYTINIRASSGSNIVTSFAFVSDVKAISYILEDKPFIQEFDYSRLDNKTGLVDSVNATLNSSVNGSLNDTENEQNGTSTSIAGDFVPTNVTEKSKTTNLSHGHFGFGVHILGYKIGDNKNYHGLFWAHNAYSSIQRWFRIDFDPTEKDHSYVTSVNQNTENKVTTTDLVLLVDNQEVVNIAGLRFEETARISLMAWNEEDYRPPIEDVFNPFYTVATVKTIDIPDDNNKLCLQGRPFYDGESGIKEIWAGISDSTAESDNIANLELYHHFCFPCEDSCSILCNDNCTDTRLSDDYNIINLNISNLNLKETDMKNGCFNVSRETDCNSTSYYIAAKVVNFAGQITLVHSNAVQIDITPPTCEYLKCFDPDYSINEPTTHLGSSSAIGAYWKCSDDVSMIDYYEVYVTSFDGQETVIQQQQVGTKTKIVLNKGNDTFKDKHDYMVHLTVVNSAGLRNFYNCSVSVSLFPPNVSSINTKSLFAYEVAADEMPATTDSQSEIGLKWIGGNTDIEFYEWQLGTSPEAADIFPPVKVGINETGSAAIVHGKLELNEQDVNKTVSEFHKLQNISNNTTDAIREKTFFLMEPGRCVHQTMHAIGWSHLKSRIKSKTVCVKRNPDIEVTYEARKPLKIISKTKLTNEWRESLPTSSDSAEIVIETEMVGGGLTAGSLTNEDKTASYGSAGTSDFKSYISDPKLTSDITSRILRNRFGRFCNMSFFIAPTPVLEFNDIRINITLPKECKADPEFQPALIYWDKEASLWRHIDEGCEPYLTHMDTEEIYTSHVCPTAVHGNVSETKRSTRKTYSSPRAYELAHIAKVFPNHPPVITTNDLQANEDTAMQQQIKTFDQENDTLTFEIIERPKYAICNISQSGILNCLFEEDFYGNDYITLKIAETGLPPTEVPLSATKRIPIRIQPVPDATVRFFVDTDGNVRRENRPSMTQMFHTNANSTESFFAGTIILADADGDETFSYKSISKFSSLGNSTVSIQEVDISQVKMGKAIFSRFRTMKAYKIEFAYSKNLNGEMTLNFIAVNTNGEYTPSVTMELYILKHPCVHGSCSHINNGPEGCHDVSRSLTFDNYICVCMAGYTDQWCQTNINECTPEPCALMFDCEDLVNGYSCNINVPKLMAILLCSVVAVAGVIFIARRSFMRHKEKYRKVGQSNVSLMNDIEQIRPSSSRRIFLEPAVTSLPPVNTERSFSTDTSGENTTKPDPSLDLPSLAIFGPGFIKPTHHLKSTTNDMNERQIAKPNEKYNVTVQRNPCSASSSTRQSGGTPFDGDIGGVMLHVDERLESRLTDIDV